MKVNAGVRGVHVMQEDPEPPTLETPAFEIDLAISMPELHAGCHEENGYPLPGVASYHAATTLSYCGQSYSVAPRRTTVASVLDRTIVRGWNTK